MASALPPACILDSLTPFTQARYVYTHTHAHTEHTNKHITPIHTGRLQAATLQIKGCPGLAKCKRSDTLAAEPKTLSLWVNTESVSKAGWLS